MEYTYTYADAGTPQLLGGHGVALLGSGAGALAGSTLALALVILIVAAILTVIGKFKALRRAGHPRPWAAIVPFYSDYEMSSLTGLPMPAFGLGVAIAGGAACALQSLGSGLAGILGLGYFVVSCIMACLVGKRFGKGVGFRVGLCIPLVSCIFWMMLGCGKGEVAPAAFAKAADEAPAAPELAGLVEEPKVPNDADAKDAPKNLV